MDNQAQLESHQVGGFLNEMRLIVDSLSRKYLDRFAKRINLAMQPISKIRYENL